MTVVIVIDTCNKKQAQKHICISNISIRGPKTDKPFLGKHLQR